MADLTRLAGLADLAALAGLIDLTALVVVAALASLFDLAVLPAVRFATFGVRFWALALAAAFGRADRRLLDRALADLFGPVPDFLGLRFVPAIRDGPGRDAALAALRVAFRDLAVLDRAFGRPVGRAFGRDLAFRVLRADFFVAVRRPPAFAFRVVRLGVRSRLAAMLPLPPQLTSAS